MLEHLSLLAQEAAETAEGARAAQTFSAVNLATNLAVAALLIFLVGFLFYKFRQASGSGFDPAEAELEFERQMLAQFGAGASGFGRSAPQASSPLSADPERLAIAEAATMQAPAVTAEQAQAPAGPPSAMEDAFEKAPVPAAAAPMSAEEVPLHASAPGPRGGMDALRSTLKRLEAIRHDVRDNGRVGNLSGAEGVGLYVSWDGGRMTALIIDRMPSAEALPSLLKRFEVVIVAAGGDAEPVVLDRLGAYFARSLSMD